MMITSGLDTSISIDDQNWAVTLINRSEHSRIVIESVEENNGPLGKRIKIAEFASMEALSGSLASSLPPSITEYSEDMGTGAGKSVVRDMTDDITDGVVRHDSKGKTHRVAREKVEAMIALVEKENVDRKNYPTYYSLVGSQSFFSTVRTHTVTDGPDVARLKKIDSLYRDENCVVWSLFEFVKNKTSWRNKKIKLSYCVEYKSIMRLVAAVFNTPLCSDKESFMALRDELREHEKLAKIYSDDNKKLFRDLKSSQEFLASRKERYEKYKEESEFLFGFFTNITEEDLNEAKKDLDSSQWWVSHRTKEAKRASWKLANHSGKIHDIFKKYDDEIIRLIKNIGDHIKDIDVSEDNCTTWAEDKMEMMGIPPEPKAWYDVVGSWFISMPSMAAKYA